MAYDGMPLSKVMPATAKTPNERTQAIKKGWSAAICNDADDFDWSNLNRRYYIEEAYKLIEGVGKSIH